MTSPLHSPGFVSPAFRAFQDLPREHGYEPLRVEGAIPEALHGSLVRSGPSLFSSFGERYRHWFDGDGAVSAVRFQGGEAEGAVRLVQSAGLLEERRQGRRIFATYGTPAKRGWLGRLGGGPQKNVANIAALGWNGRLFALYQGSLPTEIRQADLETLGASDLGGLIPTSFSGHPHRVEAQRATYGFGLRYGRVTELDLFELRDDGAGRRLATLPLPGPVTLHDFIATQRHLIFFIAPQRLRLLPFLLGRGAVADNLAWRPELGTEVIVVPIDSPHRPIRFTTDAFYQWHFANAFERGGEIVIDFIRYPDDETVGWLGAWIHGGNGRDATGTLHRAVLDPEARTLRVEERWAESCEFPTVSPKAAQASHRFVFVASHAPGKRSDLYQRIAKVDVERGVATQAILPDGHYPSEPILVPRAGGGEDEGWLLSLVYDANTHSSHVAILDAADLGRGPLARAHFDHHIPFTFHGTWLAGK